MSALSFVYRSAGGPQEASMPLVGLVHLQSSPRGGAILCAWLEQQRAASQAAGHVRAFFDPISQQLMPPDAVVEQARELAAAGVTLHVLTKGATQTQTQIQTSRTEQPQQQPQPTQRERKRQKPAFEDAKTKDIQLGLFRHFAVQQQALRVIQGAEGPAAAKPAAASSSARPSSAPARPSVVPPLSFVPAPSVPAPVQSQPGAFTKYFASVTPRKPAAGSIHSTPAQSGQSSPRRHAITPTRPITISLRPNSHELNFPSSLEFTVNDLRRLHYFVQMLQSLQPADPQLAYLSPAAVILKVMEPSVFSAEDGTPLVSSAEFYKGVKFLLKTTTELQGVPVDSVLIDDLLECVAAAYSPGVDESGEAIDVVCIQELLLAVTLTCEDRQLDWSNGFRLVDADNRGRINRTQLAQLFKCCLQLLFGLHDGLKQQYDAREFRQLVDRVVQASVDAFFPMADVSAQGTIALEDFQRVRSRYANLLPWLGLIQEIQNRAVSDAEEDDEAANANLNFDSASDSENDEDEPAEFPSDTESDTSASSVAPILSVDITPSLPEEVLDSFPEAATPASRAKPHVERMLNLSDSALYHLFFMRSLAVTLDPASLIQTVLLVEEKTKAATGNDTVGLSHAQFHAVTAYLFPVHLLPKAYDRLLSSCLSQLFLLLSTCRGGASSNSKDEPRVSTLSLILSVFVLLPSSNETNLRHAWEYLAAVTTGHENFGCLRRGAFEELISSVLLALLSVASETFHISTAHNTISLRAGVQEMVASVTRTAADFFFGLANVRIVEAEVPTARRRTEPALSYAEFARINAAYPTALPWVEVLDGLVEGEGISRQQQQRDLDESAASRSDSENDDVEHEPLDYSGIFGSTDGEYEDSPYASSSAEDSSPSSPRLSEYESAMMQAAISSRQPSSTSRGAPATSNSRSVQRAPATPQMQDARRAIFTHWKASASPNTKKKLEAHEAALHQQDRRPATAAAAVPTTKPAFTQKKPTSGGSSANSSRRSSVSSAGSRGRRPKKVYAQTLSVDPFQITMHTATNPSPRAVLSAVKVKPLPVFTLHSSAPKLLLCLPLHAEESSTSRFGFSSSVQSLKVYDSDLPAFSFFKAGLKNTAPEDLCRRLLAGARIPMSRQTIQKLFETRMSRIEFGAALRELLDTTENERTGVIASPQQLQTYTVALFRLFDHQACGEVSLGEVVLALTLLLDLTPDEKLRFAFRLISDSERSGTVSQSQLVVLFRSAYTLLSALCSTHFRMSVPSQPGSPAANSAGPLSPSSLHSLPHELVQARLESTARHQAAELFRLASAKQADRLTLAEFEDCTARHKHLINNLLSTIDLDCTFSPKHSAATAPTITPAEIHQSQSQFERDMHQAARETSARSTRPATAPRPTTLRVDNFAPNANSYAPMGSPSAFPPQ